MTRTTSLATTTVRTIATKRPPTTANELDRFHIRLVDDDTELDLGGPMCRTYRELSYRRARALSLGGPSDSVAVGRRTCVAVHGCA